MEKVEYEEPSALYWITVLLQISDIAVRKRGKVRRENALNYERWALLQVYIGGAEQHILHGVRDYCQVVNAASNRYIRQECAKRVMDVFSGASGLGFVFPSVCLRHDLSEWQLNIS